MRVPSYQLIENEIKEKIKKFELKHGVKIPSENELKETYGVSRMTVRQALNNLVNDGFLYRHRGKGTFVNHTKMEKRIQGLLSFTEEMQLMNRKVTNKVASFQLMQASEEVAAKLFLNKNEEVYRVERVRSADGIPVLYETLYLPRRIFKDLTEQIIKESLYNYIEKTLKMSINFSIQSIEAVNADETVSNYLGLDYGSAVLHITLNTFLDNGHPFEYVTSYYRADQYRFIQHAFR